MSETIRFIIELIVFPVWERAVTYITKEMFTVIVQVKGLNDGSCHDLLLAATACMTVTLLIVMGTEE